MMRLKGAMFAMWLLYFTGFAVAAEVSGGVIVRISDDAASRCISTKSDLVSFNLVRVLEQKASGFWSWFKSDKSIGLYIDTTLEGATDTATKRVNFPRAFLIDVQKYPSGAISLPVEERLLSQFKLFNNGNSYTSAKFSIKLVRITDEGPAAQAIRILADVTKSFPMPANPFATGFEFFVDLSNKLVDGYVNDPNDKDTAPVAQLSFEFSSNGDCTGNLETTGTVAILFSSQEKDAVDIGKEDEYCFKYISKPTKSLRYAPRQGGSCPTDDSGYHELSNSYYLFLLNAVRSEVAANDKGTQYSWFRTNSVSGGNFPIVKFAGKDIAAAVTSWKSNVGDASGISDKALADYVGDYIGKSPSKDVQAFDFQKTWMAGDVGDTIADIAGVDKRDWEDVTIGRQTLVPTNAVAQDIAASMIRCGALDIPIDKCF